MDQPQNKPPQNSVAPVVGAGDSSCVLPWMIAIGSMGAIFFMAKNMGLESPAAPPQKQAWELGLERIKAHEKKDHDKWISAGRPGTSYARYRWEKAGRIGKFKEANWKYQG